MKGEHNLADSYRALAATLIALASASRRAGQPDFARSKLLEARECLAKARRAA